MRWSIFMPEFYGVTLDDSFPEDIFTDDLRKSALTQNPTIIPEIDYVWVLSGRSTILGNDADGLKREFDHADDLGRMSEGVRIATRVNLLRAGKEDVGQLTEQEWVTPIFYNGRKIHNQDLKKAIAEGKISYPDHLFIIEDIDPENIIGQIRSFKNYFSFQSENVKNIAVVSSAYHIPRVARTIGNTSPQTEVEKVYFWQPYRIGQAPVEITVEEDHPIRQFNFLLFGVYKQEKRPGIVDDLRGECRAMLSYSSGERPSIARQQSNNTFFNDGDIYGFKSFKRALFWHRAADAPLVKTTAFSLKNDDRTGVLRLLTRPEHIEHHAASTVLVESFIGEYQKYLKPQDIDSKLNRWRGWEGSVEHYYQEYYKDELSHFLAGKLDYWVEARIGGTLVGWATFERERSKRNEVYMNLLIVAPDCQGKAIGSQLVMSLIHLGLIPNLDSIHLLLRKKNEGGRIFYSKLGFFSDPDYVRNDNFVNPDLLEALTWYNPALQYVNEEQVERSPSLVCDF